MKGLTAYADEAIKAILVYKQHISLLGFIRPDLHRAHAMIGAVDLAQLKFSTESGVSYKL